MADMAKIFWSGRSQAVRLPKPFRFDGSEVRIRREGDRVILEPVDAGQGVDAVADAAADEIDRVRGLIRDGLESGEPVALDMDRIKQGARSRPRRAD